MTTEPDRLDNALIANLEAIAALCKRVSLKVKSYGHAVPPAQLSHLLGLADKARSRLERASECVERAGK